MHNILYIFFDEKYFYFLRNVSRYFSWWVVKGGKSGLHSGEGEGCRASFLRLLARGIRRQGFSYRLSSQGRGFLPILRTGSKRYLFKFRYNFTGSKMVQYMFIPNCMGSKCHNCILQLMVWHTHMFRHNCTDSKRYNKSYMLRHNCTASTVNGT